MVPDWVAQAYGYSQGGPAPAAGAASSGGVIFAVLLVLALILLADAA